MKIKRIGKSLISIILAVVMLLILVSCSVSNGPYNITVTGGIIQGDANEDGTYNKDTLITLVAEERAGETFAGWQLSGVIVSTEPTYSFTATKNSNYTAIFTEGPYNGSPNKDGDFKFYDNFRGNSLDMSKWGVVDQGGGFGNSEKQWYTPDNLTVDNGILRITAKKESRGNETYTSAKIWTQGKFSGTYGRIESRIRMYYECSQVFEAEDMQGLWPAFWMMPQSSAYGGWPQSGEIDIMENRGRLPNMVGSTLHRKAAANGNGQTWITNNDYVFPEGQNVYDWHVYACEWDLVDTDKVEFRFYVDDTQIAKFTSWTAYQGSTLLAHPKPFDKPFYIIFNFAIGGNFDSGRAPSDKIFAEDAPPVSIEIDYVAWSDIISDTNA